MPKPEDVLEQILTGELTRDQAIEQQPEMEDRLLLLTELTDDLRSLPQHAPDAEFRLRTRMRLLQHIEASHQRRRWWNRVIDRLYDLPGWASTVSAVVIATGGLTFGVSYASASALPDDRLYPVKRVVEQVQVAMASSNQAKANTYLDLADRRAAEIAATAGELDAQRLAGLTQDYGKALQGVSLAVQALPGPPAPLIDKVQSHVASEATELEARALNSSSRPMVQEQLVQAEVVASNTVDHVALVAEKSGKPGPQDVHLAQNARAAATAAAAVSSEATSTPVGGGGTGTKPADTSANQASGGRTAPSGGPGANSAVSGASGSPVGAGSATARNGAPAGSGTANASGGSTAGVANVGSAGTGAPAGSPAAAAGSAAASTVGTVPDGQFDHLWNEVAGAAFMGQHLRTQLEVDVANAKQDLHAGRREAAVADMNAFITQLQAGLAAHQATQYTATRLLGEAKAIIPALQASPQLGVRTGVTTSGR